MQVSITWYNPNLPMVEDLRGSLISRDSRYFRLTLDDGRTVSIPTGFIISVALGTENMEGNDSPQGSALGSAMQGPTTVRYWNGSGRAAEITGVVKPSDDQFVHVEVGGREVLIGSLWVIEIEGGQQ